MNTRNSQGFTAIEGLLIVGTLLLIAGIGTFWYARGHGGRLPFTGATSTPTVFTGSSPETNNNGVPAGAGQTSPTVPGTDSGMTVVRVPEAGFSITVPGSLKDLTYHAVATGGGGYRVGFSTAALTAAVAGCAASNGNGAFAYVTRGNGKYPGSGGSSSGGLLQQYTGYYLAYSLPTTACAKTAAPSAQSLADTQAQDFYTALSSVRAL